MAVKSLLLLVLLWSVLVLSSTLNVSSEFKFDSVSTTTTTTTIAPSTTSPPDHPPGLFQIITGSRRPRTLNLLRQWFFRLGDQFRNFTRSFRESGGGGGSLTSGIGSFLPSLWSMRSQPLNLQSSELKMRTWKFNTQSQSTDLLPDSLLDSDRIQLLQSVLRQDDRREDESEAIKLSNSIATSNRIRRSVCNCGLIDGNRNGNNSQPWLVALLRSDSGKFVCTGVLLSQRFLLTSSNCVQQSSPSSLHALFGALHLLESDHLQTLSEQVRDFGWAHIEPKLNPLHVPAHSLQVRQVKLLKSLQTKKLSNDLAILEFEERFESNSFVRPLCLPLSTIEPEMEDRLLHQQTLFLLGWGAEAYQPEQMTQSGLLRVQSMTHQSLNSCNHQWQELLGQDNRISLDSRHVCARPSNEDADDCRTELGSPLIGQDHSGRYRLIGLAPVETRCSIHPPLVFTRVSHQLQSLHSILKDDIDQC